jgi:peptidoglycan/LPS O-acetylase OafA/YrhL
MTEQAIQGPERIDALRSLRGIGVLLVVISHFTPGHVAGPSFTTATGTLGVVLFFYLSGYLMERTLARGQRLPTFAVRRAARILPMYWVSILIALTIGPWTLLDAAINAAFLVPLTKTELMSGVYWTLYIEVVFYVVVPFIALSGDRAIKSAPYVAMALNLAIWLWRGQPSHTLYHLSYCLAGMQFGLFHRGASNGTALFAAVAATCVAAGALSPVSPAMALVPAACALALWFSLTMARGFGPLSFMGDVSYSWYLLHAAVGLPVTALAIQGGLNTLLAALLGAGVSLLLSWATFRLIERPAMKMAAGRAEPPS